MAKKRREKKDDEEIDFKLPKFDEAKFLKKERRNIRTLFISLIFGFIIAIISFGFWVLLVDSFFRWELILLLGVFNASWLKYLFIRLNIDLTDFGRKGWFGSFAIYFFTWLIVLIILVNPPFYDDESPLVEVAVLPEMQEIGGSVYIVARIVDNVGVKKENIEFTLTYPDGTDNYPEFIFEDNIFSFTYENTDNEIGKYSFKIETTDNNGMKNISIGNFDYSNDTIKIASPANADVAPGPIVTYADPIRFDVDTYVSRLYYKIDDGIEINVTHGGEYYETSPKQIGWQRGKNATLKAYAEIIYYFENVNQEFKNTIVDTDTYYFNVSDSPEVGTEASPEIVLPKYTPVQVPGFELIIFVVSLVIVAFIFKWKKKDKKK